MAKYPEGSRDLMQKGRQLARRDERPLMRGVLSGLSWKSAPATRHRRAMAASSAAHSPTACAHARNKGTSSLRVLSTSCRRRPRRVRSGGHSWCRFRFRPWSLRSDACGSASLPQLAELLATLEAVTRPRAWRGRRPPCPRPTPGSLRVRRRRRCDCGRVSWRCRDAHRPPA
jgi:hypothetical protein